MHTRIEALWEIGIIGYHGYHHITSGYHGGRQACIRSLTLTSGLFSRAWEKPQQWSHAYFKSRPMRGQLWGPPALGVSAKGYITCQRRGSSGQREGKTSQKPEYSSSVTASVHTTQPHTLPSDKGSNGLERNERENYGNIRFVWLVLFQRRDTLV